MFFDNETIVSLPTPYLKIDRGIYLCRYELPYWHRPKYQLSANISDITLLYNLVLGIL